MTGLRKYLEMSYRGIISGVLEFPELSDRKDGNVWALNFNSDIGDILLGSVVLPVAAIGTAYVDPTHASPIAAAYGKMNGTNTIFTKELVVGDVVLVNGLYIRQISAITSDTVLYFDYALDVAVTGVTMQKKLANGFWDVALTGIVASDASHMIYTNPYYNHVYSADAAFANLIAGDKIAVLINSIYQERIIEGLVSTGEAVITEPFYGDLTGIDSAPQAAAARKTFDAYPITNTGNSNSMKIMLWTETTSGGYEWIVFSQKNLDGTREELIPAGVPTNAVATETVITFTGQPTATKIVTFGDEIYEWFANGGSPDPYTDNIDVEIGLNTDGSITNLEAAINLNSTYHVTAVKNLGTDKIAITATSLFEFYNDLPTTDDDGNVSFPDVTFGGGAGASTTGVNATPCHKGERLLDTVGSKIWFAKDDNTNVYSLTKYWYYMAIA